MKKTISIVLTAVMLLCNSAEVYAGSPLDFAKGALDSAGDAFNSAKDWAGEKGGEALDSAGSAVSDAGDWIADKGGDVLDGAGDAWSIARDWTIKYGGQTVDAIGDALGVSADWVIENGGKLVDSTGKTISSAWDWTSENAPKELAKLGSSISGQWDTIFGKADEKGPHHLCISTPLFETSDLLESRTDAEGYACECFEFNDIYRVTELSIGRDEDDKVLFFGDVPATDMISSLYDNVEFSQELASGGGKRAMAQQLDFKGQRDKKNIIGRAECIWTDHYSVILIVDTEEGNESENADANDMFDIWMDTLSVYETNKNPDDITEETEAEEEDQQLQTGILTASNVKTANRFFDEYRFHSPKGGHGFAAEQANTLADNIKGTFKGEHATVVGDDNAKNGADRKITLADGTEYLVQTKYHSTAQSSIAACFGEDGNFRYMNADGKPMQVEVPSDQYDDAVRAMEQRIRNGEVPNVSDPAEAKNIVRKGTVTYKQARNIAKAGNIDSITYDAVNGVIESAYSFGISASIEFAVSVWNGESVIKALKSSAYTGLQVGGTSFVISVLAGQLSKSALNSAMVGSSEAIVNALGPKAAATFVNAFRTGGNIYGAAAMKSAAKLLRGNVITSSVSLIVVSVPDIIKTFKGEISPKQLAKNVAESGGGLLGGLGGWYGGAAIGTLIAPGIGTVIGGLVVSVAGGIAAQKATSMVADLIAEDDADEMLDIVGKEYEELSGEYLLNEKEAEQVTATISKATSMETLTNMYQSKHRELYAREVILRPAIESVTNQREKIDIPVNQYEDAVSEVLEDIYDESQETEETELAG